MTPTACPTCFLPVDDPSAWQCDGCGYQFDRNYEQVQARLRGQLRTARTVFWATLVFDIGIAAGTVYLASQGFIVVLGGLIVAAVGLTARAAYRISQLKEHLAAVDRRLESMPKARVHRMG